MPDRFGQLTALATFGGGCYGGYIKAPAAWVGQGIFYGLVSYGGAKMTSKDPGNVTLQLISNGTFTYITAQEMIVKQKNKQLYAPLIAINALNMLRCVYALWNKDEPVRQI